MRCIICGSTNFSKLILTNEVSRYTKRKYPLFKCMHCRLVRPNPLPYQENEKDTIYSSFDNIKFFDKKTQKIIRSGKEYEYYFKHFKPYLNIISKYKISGKALDIGCGAGHLLKIMQKNGIDAEGLEISKELVTSLNSDGFKVFYGEINDQKIRNNYYDLVTLNQVLEHVADPVEFVKNLNRVLKKNGYVILAVPYLNGLVPKILRSKWYGLGYGQHLNFFSEKSLRILLEKQGFEILEFRRLIVDYAHPKFPKILNILADTLSQAIVSLGLGDNLFLIAKKLR